MGMDKVFDFVGCLAYWNYCNIQQKFLNIRITWVHISLYVYKYSELKHIDYSLFSEVYNINIIQGTDPMKNFKEGQEIKVKIIGMRDIKSYRLVFLYRKLCQIWCINNTNKYTVSDTQNF